MIPRTLTTNVLAAMLAMLAKAGINSNLSYKQIPTAGVNLIHTRTSE